MVDFRGVGNFLVFFCLVCLYTNVFDIYVALGLCSCDGLRFFNRLADENAGFVSSSNESSSGNPNDLASEFFGCGTVFGYEYLTEFSRLSIDMGPKKSSKLIVANESVRLFVVRILFLS